MYYYLVPKTTITVDKIPQLLAEVKDIFKYKVLKISNQNTYIWSIFFEDTIKNQSISIYLSFFYKNNGNEIEGIRLLMHNPTITKDEEILEQLQGLLDSVLSLAKSWKIFDLYLNEFIEIPIIESVQQYSSMFRSIFETVYAENEAERSLYVRIMRLDMPNVKREEPEINNLIDDISKIKTSSIQKLFLYHFATHIKNHVLATEQFRKLHQLLNKYDTINDDLCLISKLNLYTQEYAIYHKETLNTGNKFVKQVKDRTRLSDYMYSLLIEYFHQRGKLKQAFEIALLDLDTYNSEFSRQYLKDNLNRIKGKAKFSLFLKLNKSSNGKLIANQFISKLLILSITLVPFIVSYLLFIVPIILDSNIYTYVINTDFLLGIVLFTLMNIIFVAFILTVLSVVISIKSTKPTKVNKILNISTIIVCIIIITCSLIPAMYITSTSITYIGKDKIGGNGYEFSYNEIDTVHINLINPDVVCPDADKSARYPCLYSLEISITPKASEKIMLWRDFVYNEDYDTFIFKDDFSNKYFLELIKQNNIKIETNFTQETLDSVKISKSYKQVLVKIVDDNNL